METEEALALISKIDLLMAAKTSIHAIPPDIFETLEDVNASWQAIEAIGSKLSPEIGLKLTAIAGAVYLGTLRRGQAGGFFDVVNCLGMERTKALIIMLSTYLQGKQDPEIEAIFAQSYATAIMAMILAAQTGFREDAVKKAELCGLYMDIGRKFLTLYKHLHPEDSQILTDDFIDTYHTYLGEKIAVRYSLPDYIQKTILARTLILEENHISLMGIVQLAHDTVETSFRKYHNRLVLKCQIPRPATDVTRTLEAIVSEKFKVLGLDKYLYIIKIPRVYDI